MVPRRRRTRRNLLQGTNDLDQYRLSARGLVRYYSRLAATYLGKYVPGDPRFIVQSKPGGIGVLRSFCDIAPRDGSTIGIFPETIAIVQLTQPDIGKWKVQELSYIGSFANVNAVFMVRKGAPASTVEELKKTSINVGCNSPLGVSYINPAIMKTFGGLQFKIVCGYPAPPAFRSLWRGARSTW